MCRKKKRVIHPRYHSPCQTPYTALRSLLSVALSSGMVKSNLIIPFISDKVNVQPFRRHCSVISDEGVQFKTARVFNSTAIFNEHSFKRGSAYSEVLSYVIRHQDSLIPTLAAQQKEIFEKLKDCEAELHGMNEREAFISGFKLVARIMTEVLCKPSED